MLTFLLLGLGLKSSEILGHCSLLTLRIGGLAFAPSMLNTNRANDARLRRSGNATAAYQA